MEGVFTTGTSITKGMDVFIKNVSYHYVCLIESFNLYSGTCRIGFTLSISLIKNYFCETDLFTFDVAEIMTKKSQLPTLPVLRTCVS